MYPSRTLRTALQANCKQVATTPLAMPSAGHRSASRLGRCRPGGEADAHTYIVGPDAEIPLNAQLRGSTEHGINNLCGPTGCE
jgi:hypothetical protein